MADTKDVQAVNREANRLERILGTPLGVSKHTATGEHVIATLDRLPVGLEYTIVPRYGNLGRARLQKGR